MERGSIVICIRDDWSFAQGHSSLNGVPKKDKLYTIRDVYTDPGKSTLVGIRLEEIKCNINERTRLEFGWDIIAFKELISNNEYNQEEINNLIKEPQYK